MDTASTAQLTAQQQLRSPNKISDAGYKLYLHLVLLGGGKVTPLLATPRCTLHSCLHLRASPLHIADLLLSPGSESSLCQLQILSEPQKLNSSSTRFPAVVQKC